MPAPAIFLFGVACLAYAVVAPIGRALTLLIALTFIVPGTLLFPNGYTSYTSIDRLVLVAVALNLGIRYLRWEIGAKGFSATTVHAAFAWFLGVALVCGVLLIPTSTSHATAMSTFFLLLDHFVFFVVCLACIRQVDDDRGVAAVIGAVVIVTAVIAIVEHVTRGSWGHFLFSGLPNQSRTAVAARPLETREGAVRVRAGAEFALQFGWMTGAVVPLILALIALARRRSMLLWSAGLVLVGFAVVWSYSRTVLFGVGAAVLVGWLLARANRRIGLALSAGPAIVWSVGRLSRSVAFRLSFKADPGSALSRQVKLPFIFSLVAGRAAQGLGLSGLGAFHLTQVDESFVNMYAQLGVIGAISFVVLLIAGAVVALRAAIISTGSERVLAAAAAVGVLAIIGSGLTYDAFTLQASGRECWLLVALAIAIGERSSARGKAAVRGEASRSESTRCDTRAAAARERTSAQLGESAVGTALSTLGLQQGWYRLGFPLVGLCAGLIVAAAAPEHVAATYTVGSLPVYRTYQLQDPIDRADPAGPRLSATECRIIKGIASSAKVKADCTDVGVVSSFMLRLEAPSRARLDGVIDGAGAYLVSHGYQGATIAVQQAPTRGTPAPMRTAPVSGLVVGGAVAALCPLPRRRRRQSRSSTLLQPEGTSRDSRDNEDERGLVSV